MPAKDWSVPRKNGLGTSIAGICADILLNLYHENRNHDSNGPGVRNGSQGPCKQQQTRNHSRSLRMGKSQFGGKRLQTDQRASSRLHHFYRMRRGHLEGCPSAGCRRGRTGSLSCLLVRRAQRVRAGAGLSGPVRGASRPAERRPQPSHRDGQGGPSVHPKKMQFFGGPEYCPARGTRYGHCPSEGQSSCISA